MITKTNQTLFQFSEALFDDEMRYRYSLTRKWAEGKLLCFLMLNPSTADAFVNDPTVERCQRRAIEMQYSGITIVNLFPLRSTNPDALYQLDPIGDILQANKSIIDALSNTDITICAWGNHKLAKDRSQALIKLINEQNLQSKLHCLDQNTDGSPKHPLYVSYSKKPYPYIHN